MTDRLTVLITNVRLVGRSGTETWVLDFARALQARGHRPVIYTPAPGAIADELRRSTIAVVDDPRQLGVVPDVIHGHHINPTLTALLAFPRTPAVFFIHDRLAPTDQPVRFPRIRRIVPVDDTCADRALEAGFTDDEVQVVLNFVNLDRFARRPPLPAGKPARAAIFDHTATRDNHARAIVEACERAGIALDFIGRGGGAATDRPEDLLPRYDLVFAKAKAAMEAMATGCATIVFNVDGLGGLVTGESFDWMRRLNFGRRVKISALTTDAVAAQIARYSADGAAAVCDRIRNEASLDGTVDEMLALYRVVIAEQKATAPDIDAEYAAIAGVLRELEPDRLIMGYRTRIEAQFARWRRRVQWYERFTLLGLIRSTIRRLRGRRMD
ncbi:MAG: glycosyltransferase [Planctomycetota bacterium]